MQKIVLMGLILLWIWVPTTFAQESGVNVPDLTGLNLAQATARLNEVGLRMGNEETVLWTIDSPQPPNIVSNQSAAPGTSVPAGSAVDVTILRDPNMLLIYDDNDITIVNQTGNIVDVTGMRFVSQEGQSAALSVASRLNTYIREDQCFQVWSVWRNGPKGLDECRFIQSWIRNTTPPEHFWTQVAGVSRFAVLESGIERANCPAAPPNSQDNPLTCEFFYGGKSAADVTPYIYFVYTPTSIALINQSTDRWMPTDRTEILNPNVEDTTLYMGDPALFGNPDTLGDITLLAPGQCLLLTVNQPSNLAPPQPCNVIAYADINPQFAFWTAAFQTQGATDGRLHDCPAASPERAVICIVPQ